MKLFIFAVMFVASAVIAAPVDDNDVEKENFVDAEVDLYKNEEIQSEEVDVSELIEDLARLRDSAGDVIGQVEATLATLKSLMPHTIKKRQTTVSGSVERGPGGNTGRVDIDHRRGGTVYNGNVSRGPGGTSWGAGVSHQSGNTRWGANVSRNRGGTTGSVNWGRTWNNGRTRLGAYGSRGPSGNSGGIRFTHKF